MISEAALAAQVVAWLEREGWEVFSEVEMVPVGPRADIVALRRGLIAVVECKRELSFELLSQARTWITEANTVCIAFPYAKSSEGRREAFRIARDFYGYGLLEVGDSGVVLRCDPRLRRHVPTDLLRALRPEHKTHAKAGTNSGGHVTTFALTAAALSKFVAENEGCSLREAFAGGVTHHYRNDDQAEERLNKAIKQGLVEGVFSGWKGRLWPSADAARRGGTAA